MVGDGRCARRERGAAAVEFALVVPLLLVLVFGIINYGMMLSFRQAVSQSAAEGARAAAVTPAGGDPTVNAQKAVSSALGHDLTCAGGNLARAGVTGPVGTCAIGASAPCPNNPAVKCVQVTVTVFYKETRIGPNLPFAPLPSRMSYSSTSLVS